MFRPPALSAQGLTTGTLQGSVSNQTGASVADALVTLSSPATGVSRSSTTALDGSFRFSQLPAGDFEILVEHLSYQPLRMTGIPVRPAQNLTVKIALPPTTGAVNEPEVVRFSGGVLSGTLPQFNEWFARELFSGIPHRSRELEEVLRFSSSVESFNAVEGLPIRMVGRTVDAVPFRSSNPELAATLGLATVAAPLGSIEAAQLATNAVDVERSGFAGAILNNYMRQGTRETQARLFAQYTAAATGDDLSDVDRPTDVQVAGVISGVLVRDSAHFVIGVDFRRYHTPLPSFWIAGDEATAIVEAVEQAEITLQPYLEPRLTQRDAVTGFAGGQWQLTQRHRVEVRAALGVAPHADALNNSAVFLPEQQGKISSTLAHAAVLSDLSAATVNELRVAFTIDGIDVERQSEGDFASDDELPLTTFVGTGLMFGGASAEATYRRREFSIRDAFTSTIKQHQLKLGVEAQLASIEQTRRFHGEARSLFGGTTQFSAREGFFTQPIGTSGTAEFTLAQVAGFAQNTWRPFQGLEVLMGVRYEHELLPASDVGTNQEWLRLTALNTADIPSSYGKISPRFSVKWDPREEHRWIFAAGAGVYHATADADVIADLIGNDGRARVARRLGVVSDWPTAITDTAGAGRSLSIIATGYRPPVSTRASAGITRMLDAHSALHIAASYRDTRNLPRHSDLNALATNLGEDQYGRPIFGELVQQGELIAAVPGSNRRFTAFDHVIGTNSDGKSQYRAVTVMLERVPASGLGLRASYTYSKTEDNWFGARRNTEPFVAPRLISDGSDDWADGTSDFDVPHRVALSAQIRGPAGITLAGLYRYESGTPFTPSLPHGVDVNGDGFSNDPAFIDDEVNGASEIIDKWSCLRSQVGQIAERNSCRTDALQSLDLRLSARIGTGARALQINLDALNLLQSEFGLVDNALYRVDAAAQLTTAGSTTTIPLVSNPRFGEIRQRLTLPRILRVGVQYNW